MTDSREQLTDTISSRCAHSHLAPSCGVQLEKCRDIPFTYRSGKIIYATDGIAHIIEAEEWHRESSQLVVVSILDNELD